MARKTGIGSVSSWWLVFIVAVGLAFLASSAQYASAEETASSSSLADVRVSGERPSDHDPDLLEAIDEATGGAPSLADIRNATTGPRENLSPDMLKVVNVGAATSQGDAVTNADAARSTFGVDGAGVKIGIISDSYNALLAAGPNVTAGDLPGPGNPSGYTSPVSVLNDDSGSDEGRALAQIVHDLAPGATLMFHSGFNNGGVSSLATAIDNLAAAGADIIIDDVGYLNEPFFQDGPIAQAVDNAKAAGVACFSSAGNNSNEAYVGTFNGGASGAQNFDANGNEGGDYYLNIAVPSGGSIRVVVQWSDPFPSVGAPGFAADYDVGLLDFAAGAWASTSVAWQDMGADPWEFVYATNTTGATKQYGLLIEHWSGATDELLKLIVSDSGSIADDDDTNSPTIYGHTAAEGGVSVAASFFGTPNDVEWFSSFGPTEILFDTAGNPIYEVRDGPLLTSPDGVVTTVAGFSSFYGTSASAPHAAAVAALVLERAADLGASLSVDELYSLMYSSAIDIEAPGFDNLAGWGRVDALGAVGAVIPEPMTLSLLALGGLALLQRRS